MIVRIITGGQTGADQGAWRAARAAGVATGGWMPRGFRTEDGPRPEFAGLYGAEEHPSADWDARTVANVRAADATLVVAGARPGPGTGRTIAAARAAGVPCLVLRSDDGVGPAEVARWLAGHGVRVLNVAGDRESTAPGIGARTEALLAGVLALRDHFGSIG